MSAVMAFASATRTAGTEPVRVKTAVNFSLIACNCSAGKALDNDASDSADDVDDAVVPVSPSFLMLP